MNQRVFTAKKRNALIAAVIVVLLAVALLGGTFTIVDAGHTGVVVTLGKVKEGVLQEGIHAKIPFIQQVVKIDNRIRKLEAKNKDHQEVNEARAALRRSMNAADETLAERFPLSGGIIDNVAALCLLERIIDGTSPTLDRILRHCAEQGGKERSNPIGFH